MMDWTAEFFEMGHSLDDIDNMCYWDYLDIVSRIAFNRKRQGGKTVYKQLTKNQRYMIEERKKSRQRELNG